MPIADLYEVLFAFLVHGLNTVYQIPDALTLCLPFPYNNNMFAIYFSMTLCLCSYTTALCLQFLYNIGIVFGILIVCFRLIIFAIILWSGFVCHCYRLVMFAILKDFILTPTIFIILMECCNNLLHFHTLIDITVEAFLKNRHIFCDQKWSHFYLFSMSLFSTLFALYLHTCYQKNAKQKIGR